MAVVGIRSRDQIWQLALVVSAAVIVLIIGLVILRDGTDQSTTAGRLTASDEGLATPIVAGPSASNNREDGEQRSVGAIDDLDDDEAPPVTRPTLVASTTTTVPKSSSTSEESTTTETKPAESTTTTAESTTTAPPTTEAATTTEQTKPTVITLPPTTEDTIILPTITIGPPIGEHSITPEDLKAARKTWRSMGYDSYAITVRRSCFCVPSYLGPFEIVVRNGEVVSVTSLADGGRDDAPANAEELTVPGLFDIIEKGFDSDQMVVVFDKRTGVPQSISIDYIFGAVDDEMSITVSSFTPHRGS